MHLVLTFVLAALLPMLAKAVNEPILINLNLYSTAECESNGLVGVYACDSFPSDDMTCAYANVTEFLEPGNIVYSVSVATLYDGGPCVLYLFSGVDESGVEGYVPSADLAVADCFYFTDGYPIEGYAIECLDPSYES